MGMLDSLRPRIAGGSLKAAPKLNVKSRSKASTAWASSSCPAARNLLATWETSTPAREAMSCQLLSWGGVVPARPPDMACRTCCNAMRRADAAPKREASASLMPRARSCCDNVDAFASTAFNLWPRSPAPALGLLLALAKPKPSVGLKSALSALAFRFSSATRPAKSSKAASPRIVGEKSSPGPDLGDTSARRLSSACCARCASRASSKRRLISDCCACCDSIAPSTRSLISMCSARNLSNAC
mmetsp:Transcript_69636/g.148968  ORF Transcript_69636/g.148968 Transcript_69636/m.148968 type:complete len:243 (-) Transcript_69636:1882-2610(-)